MQFGIYSMNTLSGIVGESDDDYFAIV